jgi:hypothetical protein
MEEDVDLQTVARRRDVVVDLDSSLLNRVAMDVWRSV